MALLIGLLRDLSVPLALAVILWALKVGRVLSAPWWVVLMPAWIPMGLLVLIHLVSYASAALAALRIWWEGE